jgi:RNA polymerase sigma factor (sigma-70 family)
LTDAIDYHKLCKTLASRYKVTPDQREDLVQEGYLAYLECVDKGCTHEEIIETNIRKAMYNHVNFKQRVVQVPPSGQTYGFLKSLMSLETTEGLSPTEKALYFALTGEAVGLDALDKEMQGASHEGYLALGMAVSKALDEQEASVFRKIALHGYTQKEVAISMGTSQQWVNQLYQSALDKLKEVLG